MHLKFVRQKTKTYVYIMEYVLKENRCDRNINRVVVERLGDLTDALIQIEIWKRYPNQIPKNLWKNLKNEDLKNWVNSVMKQNHIYNMRG